LTHSIEVSQIARSISSQLGLEESLAEAIALAHDLGHTPFGHVGGDELDNRLRKAGYNNGFEHNFQSFRVVTALEKRYKGFNGLNLSFATLEGILKHSYPYKKSFLPIEIDKLFALDTHPSIEAMVVDRADEIAYMSHDIDDGIHSGLISFETLKESELVQEVLAKVYEEGIHEDEDEMFRYRFSSHFINHLVYSLLEYSKQAVAVCMAEVASKNKVEDSKVLSACIPSSQPIAIGFDPLLETKIKKLKKILFKELYQHKEIVRKMYAGKKAVQGLLEALMEEPKMLPKYYALQLETRSKHRVIADYIASMSDRYAMSLYNEVFGLN
jgi:dGTPase